jgi:hypothetical protein
MPHAELRGSFIRGSPSRKAVVTGAAATCGLGMGSNAVADTLEGDRPTLDMTVADRRRPGRVDYQDAQLIALLRDQPTNANAAAVPRMLSADELSLARGILIGLPVGSAMWAAIVLAIRLLA